jgi:hypothetical protein
VSCGACGASVVGYATREEAQSAWNRRTPPQVPQELQPEWDTYPWANWACLVPYTGDMGIHFRWYYWECEPEWGERSYNWVDGKWGPGIPSKMIWLRDVFDVRTTLQQRPAQGMGE